MIWSSVVRLRNRVNDLLMYVGVVGVIEGSFPLRGKVRLTVNTRFR